jgi:hypothetical protein
MPLAATRIGMRNFRVQNIAIDRLSEIQWMLQSSAWLNDLETDYANLSVLGLQRFSSLRYRIGNKIRGQTDILFGSEPA